MLDDTIAAIATPLGEGGLAVIRMSGARALAIADACFRPARAGAPRPSAARTHTLHYGHVVRDGVVVDEVLLAVMRAPRTYTREHTAEISCHGGLLPARAVLVLRPGRARPAVGSFYSLQKTNEPPLPFNPFPELQLYGFGPDRYAYDDRAVDYVALQQERLAWQLLSQATTESLLAEGYQMETMDSGPPSPGPGEPGGTNNPPTCDPPLFLTSTGLCLLPPFFLTSNSITLTLTKGSRTRGMICFLPRISALTSPV